MLYCENRIVSQAAIGFTVMWKGKRHRKNKLLEEKKQRYLVFRKAHERNRMLYCDNR